MGDNQGSAELVAYCGVYCGDCPGYKGAIADRARRLKEELEREKFERAANFFSKAPELEVYKDYSRFQKVLGTLQNLRCEQTCRARTKTTCKVTACCREKKIDGCWECGDFEICDVLKVDILVTLHGDGYIRNLRKLKGEGVDAFLSGTRFWFQMPKGEGH